MLANRALRNIILGGRALYNVHDAAHCMMHCITVHDAARGTIHYIAIDDSAFCTTHYKKYIMLHIEKNA